MEKNLLGMIEEQKQMIEALLSSSSPAAKKLLANAETELQGLEKEYLQNEKYYVLEGIQSAVTKSEFSNQLQKFLVKQNAPDCKLVAYFADGNISINMRPLTIRNMRSTTIIRNNVALPEGIVINLDADRKVMRESRRTSEINSGIRFDNFTEATRAVLGCYGSLIEEFDTFNEENERYNVGSRGEVLKNLTRGVHDIRNFFTIKKSNLEIASENADAIADENEND